MPDDENSVVDAVGAQADVALLEGLRGLSQILNHLVVEQDHKANRGGAAYVVFAINGASIGHG